MTHKHLATRLENIRRDLLKIAYPRVGRRRQCVRQPLESAIRCIEQAIQNITLYEGIELGKLPQHPAQNVGEHQ